MAFNGRHEHNLDAKDRLTIPSRLRSQLADGVVVSAGFDPCLEIWPSEGFANYASRVQAGLNPLSSKARLIRRRIHSFSHEEQLDSAGRVRIPKNLVDHAALSGKCMVVGTADHLEVWSPERWAEQAAEMESEANAVAEELGSIDWPAQ